MSSAFEQIKTLKQQNSKAAKQQNRVIIDVVEVKIAMLKSLWSGEETISLAVIHNDHYVAALCYTGAYVKTI